MMCPGSWCNLTDLMWWSVNNFRWNSSRRPWISANCCYDAHTWSLFAPSFKLNRLDTTTFTKIFTILKEVAQCDPTVVMADGDGTIRAMSPKCSLAHWRPCVYLVFAQNMLIMILTKYYNNETIVQNKKTLIQNKRKKNLLFRISISYKVYV